jgi:UPF0755 protein
VRRAALLLLFALIVAVLAVGVWGLARDRRPYRGWEGEAVVVEIDSGQTTRQIARILAEAGVVRSPFLFSLRARLSGQAAELHAGEYRFDREVTPAEVLRTLAEGRVLLHPVTVPEGLTLRETARRLAEAGVAGEEALLAAFADPSPVRSLDPEAPDLEGYLFPDTYSFPRGVGAAEVARAMTGQLRRVLVEIGWEESRPDSPPLRELLTLASLVEKESAVPEERGLVAGVFAGRLARGWRLECDPTVVYALDRDGRWEKGQRLLRADLDYPSPYNTYQVFGLPPGPICSPGRGALEAALRPAETDALYFVALGDGSGRHEFTRTLREHLAAVSRYRERRRAAGR